jgi:DNA modification methylase
MKEFINKVTCGDCLELLKKLPDESVDLIITDPPYNLNKDFDNDNLTEKDFINFLTPIINEMVRVIKPKHSIIIFFDNGKQLPLFWKCLFKSKAHFQRACNFYKPNDCSMPHNRTLRTSEAFFIISSTPELNHDGDNYIHDCLIGNHTRKEHWFHPTAKAIKVIKELIKANSLKGWVVLDPFLGSGTTAVACKRLDRRFIGVEISPEYCKIAEKRLANVPEKLRKWFK